MVYITLRSWDSSLVTLLGATTVGLQKSRQMLPTRIVTDLSLEVTAIIASSDRHSGSSRQPFKRRLVGSFEFGKGLTSYHWVIALFNLLVFMAKHAWVIKITFKSLARHSRVSYLPWFTIIPRLFRQQSITWVVLNFLSNYCYPIIIHHKADTFYQEIAYVSFASRVHTRH